MSESKKLSGKVMKGDFNEVFPIGKGGSGFCEYKIDRDAFFGRYFKNILPNPCMSFTFQYNPHKDSYQTVENYLNFTEDFVSSEEKDFSIKNNELWMFSWCEESPTSHKNIYSGKIEGIFSFLSKLKK